MKEENILFFYLSWSDGIAEDLPKAPKKVACLNTIELQNHIIEEGFDFCFKYDCLTDLSKVEDYLSNNLGIPLMSLKMKNIINKHIINNESHFTWHEVKVQLANNDINLYFVLEFQKKFDVLDREKTIYESWFKKIINGEVRKPVFKFNKIKNYSLFHQPNSISWKFPSALYVNEALKNELVEKKITGVFFSKIAIT